MPDTSLDPEQAALRIRAIANELTVAGLEACVSGTAESTYLTAVVRSDSRRHEMEVLVDDDSYVELRFWTSPDATPAQVSAVITRTIATITEAQDA